MRYLTTIEASEMLQCSTAHIRNLCIDGRIVGATKQGRDWIIPEPSLPKLPGRGRWGKRKIVVTNA